MGSIEVYDYKRQEWVPYVADYDKWYQHFKDLRDGHVQPDHLGRYIVGSGSRNRKLKDEENFKRMKEEEKNRPRVKLVTPVSQALEMAKSEISRVKERKKGYGQKRKKVEKLTSIPEKRPRYGDDEQI